MGTRSQGPFSDNLVANAFLHLSLAPLFAPLFPLRPFVSFAVEPSAHSMEPRRFLAAVSIAGFVVDGGPLRPVRPWFFAMQWTNDGDGFSFWNIVFEFGVF